VRNEHTHGFLLALAGFYSCGSFGRLGGQRCNPPSGGSEDVGFGSTGDGNRSGQETSAAEQMSERYTFTREESSRRKDTIVSLAGSFPSYVLYFRMSIRSSDVLIGLS
jgi:hypothetical protein